MILGINFYRPHEGVEMMKFRFIPPTPLIFAKKLILPYFRPQIGIKNPTHINFANS